MYGNSLRVVGEGEKEIQQEGDFLITYSVNTGQSNGIYKVWLPLGITVEGQGTSIGC